MRIFLQQILFVLISLCTLNADVLQVKPYAQWTFETAVEQIVFLESGPGYPIYMIRTEQYIRIFASDGEEIRKIERTEGDRFVLNPDHSGFMLVHDQAIAESDREEHLYSFQVYSSDGAPDYTSVYDADFSSGKLEYQLTDKRSIILSERGKPWLLELNEDDTLLYIDSVIPDRAPDCNSYILAGKLMQEDELVTAASCIHADSSEKLSVELNIWTDKRKKHRTVRVEGELLGIHTVPESDYYFLELDHGDESSLTLFNRNRLITSYPWKTWEIRALDHEEVFIISETDLNVVNLGDGALSATHHPIELRGISDAAYIQELGVFFYLRYNLFFTKEGKQAFRNFVLEGVNRAGNIVHRSSFGTWSTILPRIAPVGRDKFAIHIHNAVLLYNMEVEEN